jgi:hypothetical protein
MASHNASAKTAYDYGVKVGREEVNGSQEPPEWIRDNPDLLEHFDRGLADGTDSLDEGKPAPSHRPSPTPARSKRSSSATRRVSTGDASRSSASRVGDAAGLARGAGWPIPSLRSTGANVAGFLIGLGLYAVGANFLRNGPAGVLEWVDAKFFNKVHGQSPDVVNDPQDGGSSDGGGDVTPTVPHPKTFKFNQPKGSRPRAAPKGSPKHPRARSKPTGKGRRPLVAPDPTKTGGRT